MKITITEKPSVTREVIHTAGAAKREGGYFEGGGHTMTWALGYLVQLAMPDGYSVRGFVRDNLPTIPDTFTLVPHQVRTEKSYKPGNGMVSRIKVTKRLFDTSEQVIVTTDTGREGELILHCLYHYTGCTTPFACLWVSLPADKAIHEGLRNLEDGSRHNNLHPTVKAQGESDWLVGINNTQALSIAAKHDTYSVGRVQTPTLVIVCERYRESRRFMFEAFWQFHIATDGCDGEVVKLSSFKKRKSKEPAMELYNKVKAADSVTVTKAERKEKTEETLLLYGLTTLQKGVNAKYGFTAEQTPKIAQKLYEKKLIAYLRTGSRHIPEDVLAGIPKLLVFISTQFEWKDKVRVRATPIRRSMDNDKVTDHRALLVTGEKPLFLSKEDSIIYQMIARRMIEALPGKCVKDVTIVTAECAGMEFIVKGSIVKQAEWHTVYDEEREETTIPGWQGGDTLALKATFITEGKAKPKPLYTEVTLFSVMETAGKEIGDDALRQTMRDCDIGIPATRALIIETLFKRGYMERCKRSLVPIEERLTLNPVVKTMYIADVTMTGEQEKELARIGRGELPADTFRREIEMYTWGITPELLPCDKLFGSRDPDCACSKCGTDRMRSYGKVACRDNMEYELPMFRQKAGRTLSDDEIKNLLADGHTKPLKDSRNEQGKDFDAIVTFDREYNIAFVLPKKKCESSCPKKRK